MCFKAKEHSVRSANEVAERTLYIIKRKLILISRVIKRNDIPVLRKGNYFFCWFAESMVSSFMAATISWVAPFMELT